MELEHACFISFSRGSGKDSLFADYFFDEFTEHLAGIDKKLSVFKFDRCENRRQGDAWDLWIQRELCHSAMMIAVCAPNYFKGSPGCVSEFRGMEQLIRRRTALIGPAPTNHWLLALRLKDTLPMPLLNPYPVRDFLECFSSPEKVRRKHKYRTVVETIADEVFSHWEWLHSSGRVAQLASARLCDAFSLDGQATGSPDVFPHVGGVR